MCVLSLLLYLMYFEVLWIGFSAVFEVLRCCVYTFFQLQYLCRSTGVRILLVKLSDVLSFTFCHVDRHNLVYFLTMSKLL